MTFHWLNLWFINQYNRLQKQISLVKLVASWYVERVEYFRDTPDTSIKQELRTWPFVSCMLKDGPAALSFISLLVLMQVIRVMKSCPQNTDPSTSSKSRTQGVANTLKTQRIKVSLNLWNRLFKVFCACLLVNCLTNVNTFGRLGSETCC